MFLAVLEGVEDEDLEVIASFDRETLWKAQEMANVVPDVKVLRGIINWDDGEMALEDSDLVNEHCAKDFVTIPEENNLEQSTV
jgi:hypothetical protein